MTTIRAAISAAVLTVSVVFLFAAGGGARSVVAESIPGWSTPLERRSLFGSPALIAQGGGIVYEPVMGWGPVPSNPGIEWEPSGVASTPDGSRVYFLTHSNPGLYILDASGKILKTTADNLLVWPHHVNIDRRGDVWVADTTVGPVKSAAPKLHPVNMTARAAGHGHQVHKFSADGRLLMTLGTGVPGEGPDQFHGPDAATASPNGEIFVADGHGVDPEPMNARVVKFDKNGKFMKAWGKRGSAPGDFNTPHSLAFDSKGRLFVGDRGNARIQIFDQNGRYLTEYKAFGNPNGIAITSDDTLLVASGGRIVVGSAKDGSVTGYIDNVTAEGIAADDRGNVYAAEVFQRGWKKFSRKR